MCSWFLLLIEQANKYLLKTQNNFTIKISFVTLAQNSSNLLPGQRRRTTTQPTVSQSVSQSPDDGDHRNFKDDI